jgi:type I restriction enzyme S subunit
MNNWRSVCLGEIAEVTSGPAFKSNAFTESPADIRLLRGINVGVGEIKWEASKYWPRKDSDEFDRFRLRTGDVVLAMDRPWIEAGLKVSSVRESDLPALLVQRVARLRATEGVDQGFLRAVTAAPGFREHLRGATGGTAVPHISADDIRGYELSIPSLATQQRISAVFSSYDGLIETNERRIELLEDLIRSLYREWFVNFRFPGHDKSRFVESELGTIPEGWEVRAAGEVFDVLGGGTPSKKQSSYWEEGDIPWFTPSDLTRSRRRFAVCSSARITNLGLEKSSARLFPPGSVLMTSRATLGVLAIAAVSGTCNQGFIVIKPISSMPPEFVYEWLASHGRELEAIATGATFKEITKGAFKRFLMLIPHVQILERFASRSLPLNQMILKLEDCNRRLSAARNLLLPRLVTGQLDISDIDLGALTPVEAG